MYYSEKVQAEESMPLDLSLAEEGHDWTVVVLLRISALLLRW